MKTHDKVWKFTELNITNKDTTQIAVYLQNVKTSTIKYTASRHPLCKLWNCELKSCTTCRWWLRIYQRLLTCRLNAVIAFPIYSDLPEFYSHSHTNKESIKITTPAASQLDHTLFVCAWYSSTIMHLHQQVAFLDSFFFESLCARVSFDVADFMMFSETFFLSFLFTASIILWYFVDVSNEILNCVCVCAMKAMAMNAKRCVHAEVYVTITRTTILFLSVHICSVWSCFILWCFLKYLRCHFFWMNGYLPLFISYLLTTVTFGPNSVVHKTNIHSQHRVLNKVLNKFIYEYKENVLILSYEDTTEMVVRIFAPLILPLVFSFTPWGKGLYKPL